MMQGRDLGEFHLEETLGEGGFGTVYRAEQRSLGRPAVVKVMRSVLATRRDAIERFALEARLAARFDHPYAAHIYAFGTEPDGVMWIAMELVKGTPLDDMIRRSGPLPLDRFVPLLERLCDVVQSAHDQGIVHRDIKPSNVMVVARSGRLLPKLLDFGIAKLMSGFEPPRGLVPLPMPLALPDAVVQLTASGGPASERTLATSHAAAAAPSSLTREGQVLGSPVYMAPEQWLDAMSAGPAADQYALALLAYEAVTGLRAFTAPSVPALAELHRSAPIPPLPPHLPAGLHEVLARAAAKLPDQRFASLSEFAAAVRAASGVRGGGDSDEPVPTLPAQMLAEWLGDAPRPIADALAALAAARSWARADERISAVAALLARWIGVVAVACQSKLGLLDDTASIERELVLAMRRRSLQPGEWLDLAARLARPRPGGIPAWPIPEMAEFCASDAAIDQLRALLGLGARDATDERIARTSYQRRLDQLQAVLDQLAWLLDCAVAREAPGGLELWMGQRSDERVTQSTGSDGSGAVVLLDAYGARIVRLSPLIEIAPPMSGESDELFMFDGPGRSEDTARFVTHPRGFELDSEGVWRWLASHVLETAPRSPAAFDDDRSPYPGLAAFTARDHESFVGRERDVEELLNLLRGSLRGSLRGEQRLVTVVGPSGIGKTSFLAAGLAPALPASWQAEIIRPGSDPLATLSAITERLASAPYREGVRRDPPQAPDAIARELAALAEQRATTLVIIVDQAEELFTMCGDDDARAGFAAALAQAAACPRLRVVVALRDDFLCRVAELPAWRGRLGRTTLVLRVPGRDDLERMIALPARRRGYDFDDAGLPAAIAAEVADRPGALPLVAFTAATLWDHRDRHFRRLTRAAYQQIGGVTGALVNHADGVVDRMTAQDRRLVRLAFRRLLTSDGTRALIGRAELTSALGGDAPAAAVIDRLIAARLVVSRDDDTGDRIEVIHETLATAWPRLAGWRHDDDAAARLQDRLTAAARHWNERGRAADLLWRGPALAELTRWCESEPGAATELEAEFARASAAATRRRRRRRAGALTAGFAALTTGSLGLVIANREIDAQRSAALARLAGNFEDRGRLAIADGDDARAMLYLAEAARLGARGTGFDIMASHAAESLEAGLEVVGHGKAGIRQLLPGRGGYLTTGEDFALTWWDDSGRATRLATGVFSATLVGDVALAVTLTDVLAIEVSGARKPGESTTGGAPAAARWHARGAITEPDVGCIEASSVTGAAISVCEQARLWDVATGRSLGALAHPAAVRRAAFDASGARVATGDSQGGVRIWDTRTAALVTTCEPHVGRVRALAFSPDGNALVTGGNDRDVLVCDTRTGATLHRLSGHSHDVLGVDVAPDGSTIASVGRDGTPRLWNLRTGALETTLIGHRGAVIDVRFSPDGARLLTVGTDDLTVRLWNREGMALGALQGHGSRLSAGLWEPDGRHVLTTAYDGAIRRWDADLAIKATPRREHTASIVDLAVSPDDRWALTASDDSSAVLWDRRSSRVIARLRTAGKVQAVAFSPDGATALTTDDTGAAQRWSVPGGALIHTLPGKATAAAFARQGGVAITAGDGRVAFWSADGHELGRVALGYRADRLVLDPTGRWLFVRGQTSQVLVIDVMAKSRITELAIRDSQALGIAAGPTRVAITDGNAIRLWQLASWTPAGELTGHKSVVADLWYLGDDRLVSVADDGAMVWGQDGRMLASLSEGARVGAVAAPADGSVIATTSTDGNVRIWDATTYRRLLVLPSHRLPAYAVQVTHDGDFALSAGLDGRLVSWGLGHRTRSPEELASIVRCRVPLRLAGDAALPREIDFADPVCRAMP